MRIRTSISLLYLFMILVGQNFIITCAGGQSRPVDTKEYILQENKDFDFVSKLLKTRQVPFDPKIIMDPNWRAKLAPVFAVMPELQKIQRAGDSLNGVYIADVLLLPEHVKLQGDTVILVHQIAPDDENLDVEIEGHHALFIFTIGEPTKMFRIKQNSGIRGTINIFTSGRCAFKGQALLFSHVLFSCNGGFEWEHH